MEFKRPIPINELTEIVIGLCIKIHSRVGPSCFERYMKRFFIIS
jgi:hypothetical protein